MAGPLKEGPNEDVDTMGALGRRKARPELAAVGTCDGDGVVNSSWGSKWGATRGGEKAKIW